MHRRKKQLLGLAGLALVAAMTALACAIPAPEAAAVDRGFKTDATTVKVQVVSEGDVPTVEIKSLQNDDIVVNKEFTVTIGYSKATELRVFVKNTGALSSGSRAALDPQDGEIQLNLTGTTCENITFSEGEQTCEAKYILPGDLTDENGVGFITRAVAVNGNAGSASNEDTVAFAYRSAYLLKFGGEYVNNGDPIMEAKIGEDVKSAYIKVYDENGKEVEIPSNDPVNGGYKLHLDQMNGDSLKFALPLWEAEALAGKYKVVLLAYDTEAPSEDGLVAMAVAENVNYTIKNTNKPGADELDPNVPGGSNNPNNPDRPGGPNDPNKPGDGDDDNKPGTDTPKPPDTGISLFRELNISRADYIVTGIVAFGVVTGFAIFLMLRRSKR